MGSSSDLPSRDRLRALGADVLVDALEHLPDACTLSRAVRDARGSAIDLKLLWMNAHARAAQPDPEAAIGGLCSRLWPAMIENGSFGACLRVLDTGVPEAGLFDWTDGETFLEGGYEYRATRVGDDLLLWVLRDSSARVRQLLETMKQREELERQLRHAQKMEVVGAAPKQGPVQQPADGAAGVVAFRGVSRAELRAQAHAVDDVFDPGGLQTSGHVTNISSFWGQGATTAGI